VAVEGQATLAVSPTSITKGNMDEEVLKEVLVVQAVIQVATTVKVADLTSTVTVAVVLVQVG
jgi:hypothetical protein